MNQRRVTNKEHNNSDLIERTQDSHKQPENQQNKEWQLIRQDSFYYKWLQKIQDYTSYKTQQTQNYDRQGSKKEPGHS